MEFRVLGPLQVLADGREIAVSANKHRVLLAALLLHANRTVTTDELIRLAWDTELPADARAALQTYVQRLRRTLGGGRIHTRPRGYLLQTGPDQLDLARFDDLLARARRATDPTAERALLAEALGLWRGAALADIAGRRPGQRSARAHRRAPAPGRVARAADPGARRVRPAERGAARVRPIACATRRGAGHRPERATAAAAPAPAPGRGRVRAVQYRPAGSRAVGGAGAAAARCRGLHRPR